MVLKNSIYASLYQRFSYAEIKNAENRFERDSITNAIPRRMEVVLISSKEELMRKKLSAITDTEKTRIIHQSGTENLFDMAVVLSLNEASIIKNREESETITSIAPSLIISTVVPAIMHMIEKKTKIANKAPLCLFAMDIIKRVIAKSISTHPIIVVSTLRVVSLKEIKHVPIVMSRIETSM